MKSIKSILTIAVFIVAVMGCKKNETPQDPAGTPFSFSDLKATNSIIAIGTTTTVTATATGANLIYSWSLSAGSLGDIIGSGAQVTYGASPCCTGNNTVNCKVKDGSGTEATKTITIVVQ